MFCVFREISGSLIKAAWEKFIAEKRLPQISRIYTDASKLFCEFREFCGSFYVI